VEAIQGVIDRIAFFKNGFVIARLSDGETVKGDMSEPVSGQEYRFQGEWEDNPRYGRQFKFVSYQAEIPQTEDGIFNYIVDTAKWVGPKRAKEIVEAWGTQALEVLKHNPLLVAVCIRGITLEKAESISNDLMDNEDQEVAAIDLESLLGGHHLPKRTIPELIKKYQGRAVEVVKENPYILQEIRGIGFVKADNVATKSIGIDKESEARRHAATLHVLKSASETFGHTWIPLEDYEEKLQKLIGIPSDGIITKIKDVELQDSLVALSDLAHDERQVAGTIEMLLGKKAIEAPIVADFEGLAGDQREALTKALGKKVFILTGAPGTGKTYTLQRMIQAFEDQGLVVALAAPTGKAAKRMTEVIGRSASTIHRLLEPMPVHTPDGLKFIFSKGKLEPIKADVVVIDEFSMVDISLAASLLNALGSGTTLLIVGDHYQLPSVGPGSVLRDLLAAEIPSHELNEIKRNTGEIVKTCHAIKDGRPIFPSDTLKLSEGRNMRHIECSDPEIIQGVIRDLVINRLPSREEKYDPVWDIQVLSPRNEDNPLSCKTLNEILQAALNPRGASVGNTQFRIGDKVIQRKNEIIEQGNQFCAACGLEGSACRKCKSSFEALPSAYLVNGDLGTVRYHDNAVRLVGKLGRRHEPTHRLFVDFRDPHRTVGISLKEHHLALAYCLTIHKMQGSEAPVIILPVHSSFGLFFNRELIYTAISRARDICITVGQWGAVEQAAQRVGNNKRITRLTKLLQGGLSNG
jgi:exodeoxyribonuclease V alpha subunit